MILLKFQALCPQSEGPVARQAVTDGRYLSDRKNLAEAKKIASQVVVHDEAVALAMRSVVPAARVFIQLGGSRF